MSESIKKTFPWQLSIFPVLEMTFFILANLVSNPYFSFILILIASLFLNFSIHVFFHECVHFQSEYSFIINIINTLFLGLTFDGYRIHHFNHHTYENGLKDFSSTWGVIKGKKIAYSIYRYIFSWPQQIPAITNAPDPFDKNLGDVCKIRARLPAQKIAIYLLLTLLFFFNLKTLILYLVLVYFGWAFSALHNYGQHPPLKGDPVCTYANKNYNYLFFNNGLHWEHHNKPWLSWNHIKLEKNSSRIDNTHLLYPFFLRKNYD